MKIASRLAITLLIAATAAPSAAAQEGGELLTFHCLHGCPRGTPETDDIIVREIYTPASNDVTKFADWVAYRITTETMGPSGARNWDPNKWLAPDDTLEEADYTGAPEALRIDRGRQAPLAAFFWNPIPSRYQYIVEHHASGRGAQSRTLAKA